MNDIVKALYEVVDALLHINFTSNAQKVNAAIGFIEQQAAELREATRWIPVSERLPKDNERVLVLYRHNIGKKVFVAYRQFFADVDCGSYCWKPEYGVGLYSDQAMTHWMPLPSAPKEETHV